MLRDSQVKPTGWFMLRSTILESRKEVASSEWTEFVSLVPLKAFAGSYVDVSMKMIPFLTTNFQLLLFSSILLTCTLTKR